MTHLADYQYPKATMVKVEGVVYCHVHGSVHDDTTDPYNSSDRCPKSEHRPVYFRARRGDAR
jgi:hypothetical protein